MNNKKEIIDFLNANHNYLSQAFNRTVDIVREKYLYHAKKYILKDIIYV